MIQLIVVLVCIGVAAYVIGLIPIDRAILTVIRIVLILLALLYVLHAFGVDVALPRVR